MTEPSQRLASAGVLFAAVLWGLYWIPVRMLEAEGIGAATTVSLMNAPAAVLTCIWLAITWKTQRPYMSQFAIIGLLAGLALAFYGVSIAHTSVVRATLLFYLMPIWATLIGVVWLGEKFDWRRGLSIVLGLGGLFLLMWFSKGGEGQFLGDVLAFLSGWFWAFATGFIKRLGKAPVGGMMAMQFIFVAVIAVALGLVLDGGTELTQLADTPAIWIAVAASVLGVLPAVALMFWASQFLFPGRVGILLLAEVVVAVVTASLLLPEERLIGVQWLAVLLIMGAAVVEFIPEGSTRKQKV